MNEFSRHWTTAPDLGLARSTATADSIVSPEIFALERERIYRRVWLMAGRVEDVAEPGSFFLRDVPTLQAQAVVVRGRDGQIRAFYNVCSHRGVTIVTKPRGKTLSFRCPYHSWLYATDGTLQSVPASEFFPGIDKAGHGLTPIALDVWNGFIFLNFSPEPSQSLQAFLGGLGALHETLPFENYSHYTLSRSEYAANWKSHMHTFSEGYHITTAHPRTLTPQIVTRDNRNFNFYDIRLFGPHSTLTSERNFEWTPATPTVRFVMSTMAPPSTPQSAITADDAPRDFAGHPSINRIGIPNFGVETITIFPNVCLQPLAGGYIWMQFWPLAPDRTQVEVRVHGPAAPRTLRERFAAGYATAAARDVLTEDFAITELQQRGLAMGGKTHLNFGENEALLRFFTQAVDHYLYGGAPLADAVAAPVASTVARNADAAVRALTPSAGA